MSAGIALTRELGVRSQGREPVWVQQASNTGTPAQSNDGVVVSEAIVSSALMALRIDPSVHTSRVEITTADLTLTTYTVTVDGTAVDYDASVELPADAAALVSGIAQALNDDATVGPLVTASAVDANNDGVFDTVLIVNAALETTHTTAASASGGSGVVVADEDATAASLRVWIRPKYRAQDLGSTDNVSGAERVNWVLPNNGAFGPFDFRGFAERFNSSGFDAIYLEAHTVTGPSGTGIARVIAQVGPCGDEGAG